MPGTYKYYYRPGYNSDKLLIEFISGVENENFLDDLFDALKESDPGITEQQDLWMNDEVLFRVSCSLGQFTLTKDVYGLAFIMANGNQACLKEINDLLLKDDRFEKIEVDFTGYNVTGERAR